MRVKFQISAQLILVLLGIWNSPAAPTNGPAALDEASFNIVTRNNIFNPRRRGYVATNPRPERTPTSVVDSFSLVGVIEYDKGLFAFFEGSKSDYQKVVKASEKIADFKVESIDAALVRLVQGTNTIVMPVNMQMRREEGGQWKLAPRSETYIAGNDRDRNDRSRYDRNSRGRNNNSRNYNPPTATPTETTNPGPENILSAVQQMILQDGAEPPPSPPDVVLEPGSDNPGNSGDTNEDPVLRALRERRERENNP